MSQTPTGLAALLGAEPPIELATLTAEQEADLVTLVTDARRRQSAELQAAARAALEHVPRPLRGVVKKAVGL